MAHLAASHGDELPPLTPKKETEKVISSSKSMSGLASKVEGTSDTPITPGATSGPPSSSSTVRRPSRHPSSNHSPPSEANVMGRSESSAFTSGAVTNPKFTNMYWLSDYKLGLLLLSRQALRSLLQLRQLRHLVFAVMNYHHSNAEQLVKIVHDTKQLESHSKQRVVSKRRVGSGLWQNLNSAQGTTPLPKPGSRVSLETGHDEHFQRTNDGKFELASLNGPSSTSSRVASGASRVSSITHASSTFTETPDPVDTDGISHWVRHLRHQLDHMMALALIIDKEVLEVITSFIKYNEPELRRMVETFNDMVTELEDKYDELEKYRLAYDDALRHAEFKKEKQAKNMLTPPPPEDESFAEVEAEEAASTKVSDQCKDERAESVTFVSGSRALDQFRFPLLFDTCKVTDLLELEKLLGHLIDLTPTLKRKLTLPGQSPDIFISNSLCRAITQACPLVQPTPVHLERFGQTLLDLRFLEPTLFWLKKFRCEDTWFEWTKLACDVADGVAQESKESPKDAVVEVGNKELTSRQDGITNATLATEDAKKYMDDLTESTKKMFFSMKTTFQKAHDVEEVEGLYQKTYLEVQKLRNQLDVEIVSKTASLENFETLKIELIHQSLTRLAELGHNSLAKLSQQWLLLAGDFVTKINTSENRESDLQRIVDEFAVGVFFPSNASPRNLDKKQVTQANNLFQNIRTQFNLFKDIPLQVSMAQAGSAPKGADEDGLANNAGIRTSASARDSEPLLPLDDLLAEALLLQALLEGPGTAAAVGIRSVPYFLYHLVHLVDSHPQLEVAEAWVAPLDHQQYWHTKLKIMELVANYDHGPIEVSQETQVHSHMLAAIIETLATERPTILVNFMKNWLLEIGDSLIPSTVYDLVIHLYENGSESSEASDPTLAHLLKVLGTTPRANLASLVFLLELVLVAFRLPSIPSYPQGSPSSVPGDDFDKIDDVVDRLNSMEAIGAVPFLHLLLRPSVNKSALGFKPPLDTYKKITATLFAPSNRAKLFSTLITNEENYIQKKQRERDSLPVPVKKIPHLNSQVRISVTEAQGQVATPRPGLGDFAPRPFKTKLTPAPSPQALPVTLPTHTPRNLMDLSRLRSPAKRISLLAATEVTLETPQEE